jgi:hypothetical protein
LYLVNVASTQEFNMPNPGLSVKGLPAGWKILQLKRDNNNPQDGYVVCERDPSTEQDLNFVTWYANLEMGGCHQGHYFETRHEAEADFAKRTKHLP